MVDWEILFAELREQKVLYVLALLAFAMMLDFLSGCYLAHKKQLISSKIGINGIIRKVASMVLLLFFLPLALLLPVQTGSAMLFVFYMGYLVMEVQSILENYQQVGIEVKVFQEFIELIKKKR